MDVHESLRPGMVRVTGAAIEKEFAQFAFSLLLEILDACLVSDSSTYNVCKTQLSFADIQSYVYISLLVVIDLVDSFTSF